jgi:hypothetical protein
MRPEDAARMVGWWLGHRRRFYQNIGDSLPTPDLDAHDFLAVRFMGTAHERGLSPPWHLVFEGKGGRIWENPEALPLFFMPRTVEPSADLAAMQRAAMQDDDFQETAEVVEADPAARPQTGQVLHVQPRGNGFDLAIDTATGGLVVSSVSYAPGWQARIGGRDQPAVEVDGGFLGFRVPPGSHAVRLRYLPRGWTAGLALFAAGLALALAAWWGRRRGWRGRLRRAAWPPAPPASFAPPGAAATPRDGRV